MEVKIREFETAGVRLRVDIISRTQEDLIGDLSFIHYRLGGLKEVQDIKEARPDIVWYADVEKIDISYNPDGKVLMLYGQLPPGDIQKLMLAMIVRKLQENGIYNFHSTAVNYKGKNILFMAGEENHGKTMSLIEAVRRGGAIIGTESVLVNEDLKVVEGSRDVFITKRVKGTERSDLPPATAGVWKFFDKLPEWRWVEEFGKLDLIIIPDIDGNFDTFVKKLDTYEKMYQTFICLTETYFMAHYMLSSKRPFPLIDYQELRERRLRFVKKVADELDVYLIRAKNPQIIMDEIEKII